VREDRDTNSDGFFDLRIFYDKGVIVAQEADTNGDRQADVWVRFQGGERVEQLEDQKFQGKVTARYVFKGEEIVQQEQLDNAEPPRAFEPFASVAQALQNALGEGESGGSQSRATSAFTGVESSAEMK
jgi:hypothetical protein